ncbi:MAG: bifunctional (p)ppGpp synthetase/guanosine-3',5'-bis(diphosphate) 3'-pyrophosphohydrolase [Muribaculaceae bacterium]|nr:bifunctional (p)ppGpp synthetase/guanosine-3',5'-bis(diphosphate) 3'-pyrophosphohydrolase [Muribaculaceae bacterium]
MDESQFTEYFQNDEKEKMFELVRRLMRHCSDLVQPGDFADLKKTITAGIAQGYYRRDIHGIVPALRHLSTAVNLCEHVAPDRNMILAILLYNLHGRGFLSGEEIENRWGEDVKALIDCLVKVADLYRRKNIRRSENFRNLLLSLASDLRVIVIMIVDRLTLMETINHHPDDDFVKEVATEVSFLYAPLAHRLGLYSIKSSLEDMSLKYTSRETYSVIAKKLNETKKERDAYIEKFIEPVKERLERAGLKFEIKGRTKSIHSIWNKMLKQGIDLDRIYDLFAIRIILDSEPDKEKSDCWTAYSIVTDMYQPNPSRMKDWISIPKSNGYESLHITVNGPAHRWVEVQIRTRRMDLVAERGLAAHWKYKGVKAEDNLDAWMGNVRDILEAAHSGEPTNSMLNLRMDVYDKEVFVFTPKGDLFRLPLGATLLDFAFAIHSGVGCSCTGGKVNGKNQRLSYRLHSGDTVEILTSSSQVPKQDWLSIAVTSKARNKIRQSLNELANRQAEPAKEMLMRRFKNRKIEVEEAILMKVIKKLGYKTVTDFYKEIGAGNLDASVVIDAYQNFLTPADSVEKVSAEEFTLQPLDETADQSTNNDVIVIGDNLRGVNYRLARCCNPIYGDKVFGFIGSDGVVKIHRDDCPNSIHLRERYPYRVIRTKWSGKIGAQLGVTLRVVGQDDIGIVTNISSIINKEKNTTLRSISIDSNDGLFQGHLTVGVPDNETLQSLIKKIKTVKGVKNVERSR